MSFKRSDRVRELLRHEISVLVQEINDPRLGFVTITGVDITDDLMDAKVFFSVFGNQEEREISSQILNESIPFIRRVLGKKLESLYRSPTLKFVYDETPERAERVMSILHHLSEEKEPNEPEDLSGEKKNQA